MQVFLDTILTSCRVGLDRNTIGHLPVSDETGMGEGLSDFKKKNNDHLNTEKKVYEIIKRGMGIP